MGLRAGRAAHQGGGRSVPPENHERAALVERRALDPRSVEGSRRTGHVAGWSADHVPRRRRAGDRSYARADGRQGAADLDGHRPPHRHAITRSARHRRQPSGCVGVRGGRSVERDRVVDGACAIARCAREAGHAPEAHDRVCQLGRRRVHAHLVDRMGRAACARSRRACGRVSQRRQLHVRPGLQGVGRSVAEPPRRPERAGHPRHRGRYSGNAEQPARRRLGLHRLPQLPRRADCRYVFQRSIRRLSLDVRQPSMDAEVRRPRVRPPYGDDPAVGRDGAASRQR